MTDAPPQVPVIIFCDVLCVATDSITVKNRATGRTHRFVYDDILIGSDKTARCYEIVMPRALAEAEGIHIAPVKYAVARMQGGHPRLFTGRYDRRSVIWPASPVTTGNPAQAAVYDDFVVAQAVAAVFNTIESTVSETVTVAWVPMPLPESGR